MSVIWWTDEQKEILKKVYPSADKKEIIKALKPKTWYAIRKEAESLNLERDPEIKKGGRPKKPPKQFLGKNQLQILLEKDLTITEIATKLRSEPHIVRRYITKYGL